jgi:CBS domain-containing protein
LTENHLTSAPIRDEVRGEWIGLFDYADLCSYLMLLLKRNEPMEDDTVEVKELIHHAKNSQPVPVKLISDLSQRNPFSSVYPETCLGDVMDSFGEGIHRLAVVAGGGDLQGMLSQSAVVKHLFKNIEDFPELKPLMNSKLAELGLGLQGRVFSVQNDALVLDAVQTLVDNKVSSLAVVNSQGILTGNFSMSDVKHVLRHKKVPLLWKTVQAYLNFFDQQEGMKAGRDKFPVFDVDPQTTTLAHAMAKLVATKAHRLYTTERRSGRPVGVVSLTDVCKLFAKS